MTREAARVLGGAIWLVATLGPPRLLRLLLPASRIWERLLWLRATGSPAD